MACRFRVALVAGAWLMAWPLASAGAPATAARPAAPLANAAFAGDDPPQPSPGEVLVRYRTGLAPAARDQVAHAFGARPITRYHLIDLDRVKVAEPLDSALTRFRADPRVLYAEPNYVVHALRTPNDPRFGEQYQYHNVGQTGGTPGADISALHAWDVFTGDSTLMIGMIDSGIDYDHPDLAANIWTNPGEIPDNGIDDDGDGYVDDVHGYDFANNDGDPMDDNGHGTHTAGIIAAVGNNGIGVTGVAWRARLVAIKFLNSSGSGTIADAISGLQYAVTVGCRLTSNSWGGGPPSLAMLDAINAAGQAGLLFVAAAGNSGQNTDIQPAYPASYNTPYVLSVGATDDTDSLALFSNYGPNSVDIAAPGVAILSTLPAERYGLLSGTSMACPLVAGAAALALGLGPNLGPLAVKDMLMNGADRLPQLAGLVRSGRLNAFNVIATPDSIPPGPITDLTVLDVGSSTVDLHWTATGDDGAIGRASSYDIRWSTAPITPQNFAAATSIPGAPNPSPAGTPEIFTATGLPFSSTVYLAIRALDEYANAGPISNVVSATTFGPPHLVFAPDSALGATLTGGADSTIVTLKNVGQGILAFSIPTPAIAYGAPPPPPAHTSLPSAKGLVEAQGVPTTVHAGGPDAFGYRWIDSDTTAGPPFNWIDVTAIGTQVNLNGDDFLSAPIPLGFSFPFYGSKFDSVKVCTNGFLTFTDVLPFYVNTPLPGTAAPYNAILPFWDDLLFGVERRAWVWGDGTKIVFEYQAVPHYDTGGPYTFEVILLPTGEIRFQYLDLAPPVNSATVGLQDDAGRTGLQIAYNGAYLHNSLAIKLAPIGQWVAAAPTSGRISAGDSLPVTVRFNAARLSGGEYHADLQIDSDDPSAPATHVPVRLRVVGAPDIEVVPPALDFGAVYVGARASGTLAVNNPGSDVLNVSAIAVSDTSIHVDETPFQIGRFERRVLTVTWAPDRAGPLAAALTLASNDPDTPQLVVPLAGTGLPAPSVRGDPDSLSASLRTGASTTQTLHVLNSGAGDYVFRAVPLSGPGAVAMQIDREAPLAKGAPDVRHGVSALNSGGPDDFGYTFRDSRELDGPAFRWEDARALGAPILLSGDDAVSAPLALPFAFPFYAESFSSLRVCTNGFLSFTSTSTSFSNTPLPSQATDVPENLVAPWWDDFTFPTNEAWYFTDTAHAVVEFAGVSRFGEPGRTNTFEAVLNADGSIEYRYLAVGAQNATSATVGIQNGTRDDGLLVAYNTPYLGDSLAVRITRPPRWLTVTPDTGRVAPGGSLDLGVTFHAAGLSGGRYDGRIQLVGNDPLAPHFDVPAHLDVQGVPILALHPGALDFGRVSIGVPLSLPLTVENAGSDTLRIDKLTSGDPRFTTDPSQFALAPFSSLDASVTFAPAATGPAGATLTARSNDPAAPEQTIPLTGSGAEPPRAALSATTLRSALSHDAGGRALTGVQRVVIANPGGNDLTYRALAIPGPALTAKSAPVDHESPKGQVDPPGDPSAAGSGAGGPDAFGYRWVSSDDPSGPPFQWIDARAGGTALALDQDDQLSAPIALPFPFPFYGASFDTIQVCTNGFASFTSTLTTFSNTPLPNTGAIVPRNLLAAFWDDQDFRPQSGSASAYVLGDTARFVIAFYDVPHLTIGGPYTYEIVLKRDGTIEYRYLTMGTRLTEATIGIQNGDGTIGLQAAYNAAFVHDHLTVRFTLLPPWVAVAPKSGTVAPGGADTLTVAFSAAGYPDGDYDGAVRLEDNMPGEGVRELPAHLHVGMAAAIVHALSPALVVTDRDRDVRFLLTTPGLTHTEALVDAASMRVNDSLLVTRDPADSAVFAVDVLDLLRSSGGRAQVPIAVTGEIPGDTWFAAHDTLTLSRPLLITPPLAPFGSGARVALASDGPIDVAWDDAPGKPASSWDAWFSSDGGRHWGALALGQPRRALRWMPPALVDSAMLEIVGRDRGKPVAALISEPFRLLPSDSLNGGRPTRYRLSLKGGNPVVAAAALELAVPQGGPVDVVVFDIFGARVRTLLHSTATSERVPIGWNLRDDDGRSVHPGVYFVRATSRGRTAIARLAVLR